MNVYPEGAVIRLIVTFTDPETGTNIDPDTAAVETASGANPAAPGTTTTYTYSSATQPAIGTLARTATGVYEVWVDTTNKPGYWTYRGVSTGTGQAAATDQFQVLANPL